MASLESSVRRQLSLLAATAAAVVVLACGGAAAPAGPAEEQHVDLRLGYFANITHSTALVGVRKGLFTEALGSSVTLKTSTFNAGPEAVEALLSNSIDATYI